MLRTSVLSIFFFALTTGSLLALGPKKVDDIVVLYADFNNDPGGSAVDCDEPVGSAGGAFYQIPPEGPELTAYVIPKGNSLVVTSFQWVSEDNNSEEGDPNANEFHFAAFSALSDEGKLAKTVAPGSISDANGGVGGTLVMPTGIVMPAGATICMQVGASGGYQGETLGVLQGFLVKNGK